MCETTVRSRPRTVRGNKCVSYYTCMYHECLCMYAHNLVLESCFRDKVNPVLGFFQIIQISCSSRQTNDDRSDTIFEIILTCPLLNMTHIYIPNSNNYDRFLSYLSVVTQLNDPGSLFLGERWRVALTHCHPRHHVLPLLEGPCLFPPRHNRPAHSHFPLLHSPRPLIHSLQPQQSLFTLPPLSHTAQPLSASRDKTYSTSARQTYLTRMTWRASTGCIRGATCCHCSLFPKWHSCLSNLPILFLLPHPNHRTPSVPWFSWQSKIHLTRGFQWKISTNGLWTISLTTGQPLEAGGTLLDTTCLWARASAAFSGTRARWGHDSRLPH